MATSLYILALLLPSICGQCVEERAGPFFSRSVYEFSVDLIQRLGHETENHFVASPLSLWTLLSTISVGADGLTLTEINQVLRRHPHKCFNKKFLNIVKGIASSNDRTTLERSSTVFIDQSLSVYEDYQRKLTRQGVTNIMILPFENFQTVAATINSYVSQATHGTVQDIVSPNDIEGVFVVLIDAIYFKGEWSVPFEPSSTKSDVFYDESGNHAGYVNLMHTMVTLKTAAIDPIQAKVLELPYGNGDRYSMLIILPNTGNTIASVMDQLKRVSLKSIFYSLNLFPGDTVEVRLPRFKISSDLDNLKELLVDMGLKSMFDPMLAQFPHISDYSLHVSNLIQKADIEVTEEGTVASAASEAEMTSRNLPDQFTVNKPFLYMIVDKTWNLPLFTGAYSKPSTF